MIKSFILSSYKVTISPKSVFLTIFALKGLAIRIVCNTVSLFVIRLNHPSQVSY